MHTALVVGHIFCTLLAKPITLRAISTIHLFAGAYRLRALLEHFKNTPAPHWSKHWMKAFPPMEIWMGHGGKLPSFVRFMYGGRNCQWTSPPWPCFTKSTPLWYLPAISQCPLAIQWWFITFFHHCSREIQYRTILINPCLINVFIISHQLNTQHLRVILAWRVLLRLMRWRKIDLYMQPSKPSSLDQ